MNFEQLNPAACKTYLLSKDHTAVLIDPVIDHLSHYLDLLKERNLTLTHIVDTHTHADHISAGPSLRDATDCDYIMHVSSPVKCANIRVQEGDLLTLAGQKARVLETPGHTKDSISLLFDDKLFSGDFLFLEDAGAGRDDLPGGDASAHWESLQKLKTLPDSLIVYPAHEYRERKPSSLAKQRLTNPHLKPMTKEDFVSYINDLKLGPADWMKDVLKANYKCSMDPKAAWIPTDVPACEIKGTLNPNSSEKDVHYICNDKLKEAIKRDAYLLDVREPFELSDQLGHIQNVTNIPIGQLSHRLDELDSYKDKEIVLICRSGARATTAAQILMTADFENISVLEGGMLGYRRS
jgi:glyoxylase-like metal-dependent hydrolase (beta-lactamase superfamily II)/rhodanese-related sulfurtransferase